MLCYLYLLSFLRATIHSGCGHELTRKIRNSDQESWKRSLVPCITEHAMADDLEAVKSLLSLPKVLPDDVMSLSSDVFPDKIRNEVQKFNNLKASFLQACLNISNEDIETYLKDSYFKAEYFKAAIEFSMAAELTGSIWALVASDYIKTLDMTTLENLFIFACHGHYTGSVHRILMDTKIDPSVRDNAALKAAVMSDNSGIVDLLLKDSRVKPEPYARELMKTARLHTAVSLIVDGRIVPTTEDLATAIEISNFEVASVLLGHPNIDPSSVKELRQKYFDADSSTKDGFVKYMAGRIQMARQGDYSVFGSIPDNYGSLADWPEDIMVCIFFTACMNGHHGPAYNLFQAFSYDIKLRAHNLAIKFNHPEIALIPHRDFSMRFPHESEKPPHVERAIELAYHLKSEKTLIAFYDFIISRKGFMEMIQESGSESYPFISRLLSEN